LKDAATTTEKVLGFALAATSTYSICLKTSGDTKHWLYNGFVKKMFGQFLVLQHLCISFGRGSVTGFG
jgi:hypothetical protein